MPRNCKDWLKSYLRYTLNQESPEVFHLWCGISVLAAVMNRKCWIDRGYYFTYPNHYICLVSASALCKKSTAAKIAIDLYNQIFKDAPAVAKKITLQKLIMNLDRNAKLTGNSSIFLFNDELSVLVGRQGNSELMDFMTDAYGCPNTWLNETKTKGTDVLKDVYINFLGGTTPKDLATMPATMIDGGFAGRTIFIYSDNPRPPVADPTIHFDPEMASIREGLIHDLGAIADITGQYSMDDGAREVYKELYEKNYNRTDYDFRMQPYQGRKGEHLIKLAMVVTASRTNNLIITDRDVKIASKYLDEVEDKMYETFTHVSYSSSISSKHSEKVLQFIRRYPNGVGHSLVLKRLYHYVNKDELKLIVETLEESGMIEFYMEGKRKMYRPTWRE